MNRLPNLTVLVKPSTPILKILNSVDEIIKHRQRFDCVIEAERLYAEDWDKLDAHFKKETGKRQSLSTHAYKGVQLLRGDSRKPRRNKKDPIPPFSQQGGLL